MTSIRDNIKEIIANNPVSEISTGETVGFRDYLDDAISALNLKPTDYFSALFILEKISQGIEGADLRNDFSDFWSKMEKKYGQ